jgi:hypothetical protein
MPIVAPADRPWRYIDDDLQCRSNRGIHNAATEGPVVGTGRMGVGMHVLLTILFRSESFRPVAVLKAY